MSVMPIQIIMVVNLHVIQCQFAVIMEQAIVIQCTFTRNVEHDVYTYEKSRSMIKVASVAIAPKAKSKIYVLITCKPTLLINYCKINVIIKHKS